MLVRLNRSQFVLHRPQTYNWRLLGLSAPERASRYLILRGRTRLPVSNFLLKFLINHGLSRGVPGRHGRSLLGAHGGTGV